jgi:hypothetical protein
MKKEKHLLEPCGLGKKFSINPKLYSVAFENFKNK